MINTIIHTLYWLFFGYCILSVLYLFILALFGKIFYREKTNGVPASNQYKKIAILVAAYKEDGIIVSTVHHHLEQEYPREFYDIYVIADSFMPETLATLRGLPIHVVEVSFAKSTKLKSLDQALKRMGDNYDICLICDADNILAEDVLQKFNQYFWVGAKAVQGQRVAKNLDTPFAILDACSEAVNNHIFRRGANGIGLSSSVIGSGMAFDFEMIKGIISEINAIGGVIVHEDKILQLKVIEQGHKIYYLENAFIFDEKVDSPHAFEQQRKRWISGQFIYLKQFFFPALKKLFSGNISYFYIAVANNLVLPRALLFVVLLFMAAMSFFFGKYLGIAAICLLAVYSFTIIISLPSGLINKDLGHAILKLPKAIRLMAGTLFQGKKANKTFIHTVHTRTEVTNTYVVKKAGKKD